ncbi:MAG: diaminopimelate decarboxylase [Clostridia bacterium]|nr:diaminopimelate decarboxylase [Clostridia bacterium]
MICKNIGINEKGHLTFAGRDTVDLAKTYGTPLYLMDEERIRENCRIYKNALKRELGDGALPLYAGKALCVKDVYRIMREERMGIDVVSCGEVFTAYSAGFPMENAYFHGNNKTDDDVRFAMDHGVGCFVCDNAEELCAIEAEAEARSRVQKVIIRIAPGIDPHTHKAISTGSIDSKFGTAIETGQAKELIALALTKKHVDLAGLHCHIGSQIFETEPFCDAADIMLAFMAEVSEEFGITLRELNLGGGIGVRYLESHPNIDVDGYITEVAAHIRNACKKLSMDIPHIRLEPGRSIVADAGMTLYTAGAVKSIPKFKNYLSVDGGMADNPRYALYQSPYTVEIANKMNEEKNFVCTVAGRCCESGDMIQENVPLPTPARGDIVAVLTTGAYNYAMASNYNRLPRPAMIMLTKNGEHIAVKRETFEDLIRNELCD